MVCLVQVNIYNKYVYLNIINLSVEDNVFFAA